MFRLYQRPGWGSAIVEAQLAHYGLPHELTEVGDVLRDEGARAGLAAVNPLAQVPVLVLPSGAVMTESAAITLHLADLTGRDDLVPGPQAAEREAFLRWLVFIVANIYPTFTYGDVPTRFVADPDAAASFRARIEGYAEGLWRMVEGAAAGPWFLGERFSALDIYVGVMRHWRPGAEWFAANAPRLTRIGQAAEALPALAPVFARNFA